MNEIDKAMIGKYAFIELRRPFKDDKGSYAEGYVRTADKSWVVIDHEGETFFIKKSMIEVISLGEPPDGAVKVTGALASLVGKLQEVQDGTREFPGG